MNSGAVNPFSGRVWIELDENDPWYSETLANSDPKLIGWMRWDVWIMANLLGRPLGKRETVRYKNGDKLDTRIDNLQLCCDGYPVTSCSGCSIMDLMIV